MLRGSIRDIDQPLNFAFRALGAVIVWAITASLWGVLLAAVGPGAIMLLVSWVLAGIGMFVSIGNRLFRFISRPNHEGTLVLAATSIVLMALSWLGDRAIAYLYVTAALVIPAYLGAFLARRVLSAIAPKTR